MMQNRVLTAIELNILEDGFWRSTGTYNPEDTVIRELDRSGLIFRSSDNPNRYMDTFIGEEILRAINDVEAISGWAA
jgi:hypothetical protein